MNDITACPLDCYDACEVIYNNGHLKGVKDRFTNGFLCPNLNHFQDYKIIETPTYNGKKINLNEALLKLKEILKESKGDKTLHYKGNGNFGLMQQVMEHFFASYNSVLTDGSLCDGAGEAGIINGRGSNKNMPLSEIVDSEVVIFWGRNPHTTSSHILPIIKGKKIIVIDPVKTDIAKKADIHIQLKPHGDLKFALLLSRFLYIENSCDEKYLEQRASEFEEFYELTQTLRVKSTLDEIGISLGDIGDLLSFVENKKVAIVCGVGVQKYRDGADVMRAIDAFAVALGLFGKSGCGVAYLGDSKNGIKNPFYTNAKRVSKVDTEFSNYKTVFIQGANPLSQMPNSIRVKNSIQNVENIIYFGLYENETSDIANLIIPAKIFLAKNDIRTSYSHNAILTMNKIIDTNYGISEYDLSAYLCKEFDIQIETEKFYIEHFKSFSTKDNLVFGRENIVYKDSFDTDDGEFIFLDEFENDLNTDDKLFLITPKSDKGLNSQFGRDRYVYLHKSLGFNENQEVTISSNTGSVRLKVKLSEDLREDCVLIYSGTKGVNNLTSSKHSYEGKSAIYQENKVEVKQ